jgi:SagB-type dehydrogenase family enzyme
MGSSFAQVIDERRSQRTMTHAPLREIVNAVAFATYVRQFLVDDVLGRSRRASPSAGALHPIELALVPSTGAPRVFRYNPWDHKLEKLVLADENEVRLFNAQCAEALPNANAMSLVLLGHPALVASCYHDPSSLLWRDAGAVLQTLSLTAAAFHLAFCPVGILGHQIARAIGMASELTAVGVARIGREPKRSHSSD